MMPPERQRLFDALARMWEEYPDYRFAQMVVNAAYMARGPAEESVWDVEDDELFGAIRAHLIRRLGRDVLAPEQACDTTS